MIDTPLMWTIRGNVPVDSLRYEHEWQDNEEEMIFSETWYFDDGEVARRNCHMYKKHPPTLFGNDVTVGLNGAGIGGQQAEMG